MGEFTLSNFLFTTGVIIFLIALVVIVPTMVFDYFFKKEISVQPIKKAHKMKRL